MQVTCTDFTEEYLTLACLEASTSANHKAELSYQCLVLLRQRPWAAGSEERSREARKHAVILRNLIDVSQQLGRWVVSLRCLTTITYVS
eukprot:2015398-Pyramimonas_sp.AAC.2